MVDELLQHTLEVAGPDDQYDLDPSTKPGQGNPILSQAITSSALRLARH